MENPDVGEVEGVRVTIIAENGNEGFAHGVRLCGTVSGVNSTSVGKRGKRTEIGNVRDDEVRSLGVDECKGSESGGGGIVVSDGRGGDERGGVSH